MLGYGSQGRAALFRGTVRAMFVFVGWLLAAVAASDANAAGGESIHIEYDAPEGCPSEEIFQKELSARGAHYRAAPPSDAARSVRLSIRKRDLYEGELVLITESGDPTQRAIVRNDCNEVVRALALFVAITLEAPQQGASPPTPSVPASTITPSAAAAAAAAASASDVGSAAFPVDSSARPEHVRTKLAGEFSRKGGLALQGFWGADLVRPGSSMSRGVHAFGVAHAFGTTRLGIGVTYVEDADYGTRTLNIEGGGYGGRIGGVASWGAPWHDGVAGFAAEIGVAGGQARGKLRHWSESAGFGPNGVSSPPSWSSTFVSPYVSWSLILQLPLKHVPIRPLVGMTGTWIPSFHGEGRLFTTGDIGLAWQAW